MTYIVKANFIDVFKIGDNINFNLSILKQLYKYFDNGNVEDIFLIKPIVLINTSIAEAILYDFVEYRIKKANKGEILFPKIAKILRTKRNDKFEFYIEQAKKYNFFQVEDINFYDRMHTLRKKRNRIHIQNSKWEEPYDEDVVFGMNAKILSEEVLDKIFETMTNKYPRPEAYHRYVRNFEIPWNKHIQ